MMITMVHKRHPAAFFIVLVAVENYSIAAEETGNSRTIRTDT